jgi:hypothetical protein
VTGGNAAGAGSIVPAVNTRTLNELAIDGLPAMFDANQQLFCSRLKRDGSHLVREGVSRRYTIMSLLGLLQAEAKGWRSPVAVRTVLGELLRETTWISNLGDLGLLLWLCALALPEHLKEIVSKVNLADSLASREVVEGRTMELAWLLTGLSYAAPAVPATNAELTDLAVQIYQLLKQNQGGHGIFGHQATKRTVAGVLRGRIGSFADQAYPIYALTRFAQAFKVHAALDLARSCSDAICKAQGPLGQWWWHYDASSGRVAQRYPVYSVHQDGMAPMALFALGDATKLDYSGPIYRGLAWLNRNNELRCDMRDASSGMIWRSIYRPRGWKKYQGEVLEFVGAVQTAESADDLKILFECRPYHLGWLLYAFAGRDVN